MINLPPGSPSWLQVLPPWLTLPYESIQNAIDDWKAGRQPATVAPPMPPPGGFSPIPEDLELGPGGFSPIPKDLELGPGGFTPIPEDLDLGPGGFSPLPEGLDLGPGGFSPLPPEMQGGGIHAAGASTGDAGDDYWTRFLADNAETQRVVDEVVNEVLDKRWAGDPTGLVKGIFNPDLDKVQALVSFHMGYSGRRGGLEQGDDPDMSISSVTEEQLEKIKAALYDKTQEFLKSLPDEVTIYRFGPQREGEHGFASSVASFTLDPEYNYKRNLPWADPSLVGEHARGEQFLTYKVDKKDILFYTDMQGRSGLEDSMKQGGEQEIFVDFSKVRLDENAPPLDPPPEWRRINPRTPRFPPALK